jgi:hypothetical protein
MASCLFACFWHSSRIEILKNIIQTTVKDEFVDNPAAKIAEDLSNCNYPRG